ncbi:tetraspanin Tsp2 family [Pholiota molesta]|nr:tetraspanin Tsp2 family [Pholiota molesta]
MSLGPPNPPFNRNESSHPRCRATTRTVTDTRAPNVSLTVNYLPSKFSNPQLVQRRRRPHRSSKGRGDLTPGAGVMPKMGGGVEAFRSGEARMSGVDDDDDDHQGLTIYSFVGLIACLLTWFNVWSRADIVRVANNTELITSTIAAAIGIFTCLFLFLLIPGYLSYKRRSFNLEGKLNAQWSQGLGTEGRLRIQNELQCCGYFSPFVEATLRSPWMQAQYLDFERQVLKHWYTAAFGLVPLQLLVIGMMPKAYRLSVTSMAIIMDKYASQLAEQYGEDIAADVLTRSRSDLQ